MSYRLKRFVIGGTFVVLVDVVIKVHYNKRQIPISVAKSWSMIFKGFFFKRFSKSFLPLSCPWQDRAASTQHCKNLRHRIWQVFVSRKSCCWSLLLLPSLWWPRKNLLTMRCWCRFRCHQIAKLRWRRRWREGDVLAFFRSGCHGSLSVAFWYGQPNEMNDVNWESAFGLVHSTVQWAKCPLFDS